MDKKVWEQPYFTVDNMPMWRCPFCDNAILEIQKNQKGLPILYYSETTRSKSDRNKYRLGDEHKSSLFIGMLECPKCKEIISFHGDGICTPELVYDEDGVCVNIDYVDHFYPQGFTPAIHIFPIPEKCPKEVRVIILDSFKMYWVDYASCANKIRIAIEGLLTSLKIKQRSNAGKRKDLQMRIQEYAKINPTLGAMLLAIKWIGNSGSHDHDSKIDQTAILTAYEMLEAVLIELYDDKATVLQQTAQKINANKGV